MRRFEAQFGFSLLELLVTMAILLFISAAVFGLLNSAQIRYRNEQQFLDSFQNARVGIEQMEREIHNSGYPAANSYANVASSPLTSNPDLLRRFAYPLRGYDTSSPPVYNMSCSPVVPITCSVPGPYALSMEMDLDPYNANCPNWVEIVEYKLQPDGNGTTSTLMRSVTTKPGTALGYPPNPPPATCLPVWTSWASNPWVPFIENVVNSFPGVNGIGPPSPTPPPIPIFTYASDSSATSGLGNFRTIYINLWVRSQNTDLQTNQIRTINLQAAAERLSPDPVKY